MRFPDRQTVEKLRKEYPIGCRIVLDEMDDLYVSIPPGAQATCRGTDNAGSVMASWDCGSSLSVVFEAGDRCHKIQTEEEARTTLSWYGKHQPDENAVCPRCGVVMPGAKSRHALSRRADIIICDEDGIKESLEDAGLMERLPLMKWVAIKSPQNGGGAWKK